MMKFSGVIFLTSFSYRIILFYTNVLFETVLVMEI